MEKMDISKINEDDDDHDEYDDREQLLSLSRNQPNITFDSLGQAAQATSGLMIVQVCNYGWSLEFLKPLFEF